MYRAILIGFNYKNSLKLPGVHVDLYNAYRFCKNTGADITVITDIQTDEKTENLTSAVVKDIVDSGVVSFISKIKERKEHEYVENITQMDNIINKIFKELPERVFIYFTGHGIVKNDINGLILPNEDIYSFYELRNWIMNLSKQSEIIWINDCCYVSGMGLPYKLNNEGEYDLVNSHFCPIQKLIFLGSSSEMDKALISKDGSIFSGIVFKHLQDRIIDVRMLSREIRERFLEINETRYLQPTFYASYPTIFSLYPWFFGKKIYFDNEFQSVVFVEQIKNNETLKWNSTIIKESTPVNPLETSTVCWNNMNGNDKK